MTQNNGKVAIVTGASRGIGAAVAERLASEGFTVLVNYSGDAAAAEAQARKIEEKGGRALTAKADVSEMSKPSTCRRHASKRGNRGIATSLVVVVIALLGIMPAAAEPLEFEGRIEAVRRAELSSRLNGVVTKILFDGGEAVVAGQALIELDPADAEIALAAANARLAAAEAALAEAADEAGRIEELASRGVANEAQLGRVRAELAAARAEVALTESGVQRATLDLERTVIRAPISGLISRPAVAVGAFLEAEAGPPLAGIVQLDPALVTYDVPSGVRIDVMEGSGAASVDELYKSVTLRLVLPGGRDYPEMARPRFASADVNPDTGALTVWAEIANPDGVLRPGMQVRVLSEIAGLTDVQDAPRE